MYRCSHTVCAAKTGSMACAWVFGEGWSRRNPGASAPSTEHHCNEQALEAPQCRGAQAVCSRCGSLTRTRAMLSAACALGSPCFAACPAAAPATAAHAPEVLLPDQAQHGLLAISHDHSHPLGIHADMQLAHAEVETLPDGPGTKSRWCACKRLQPMEAALRQTVLPWHGSIPLGCACGQCRRCPLAAVQHERLGARGMHRALRRRAGALGPAPGGARGLAACLPAAGSAAGAGLQACTRPCARRVSLHLSLLHSVP